MENLEVPQNPSSSGKAKALTLDEKGRLIFPAATARRYGLRPGVATYFEEGENAILLHRPASHLAKVYIEPTNSCNLRCRTCIRNTWGEPEGYLDSQILYRLLKGLEGARPRFFFGGFGEPLMHPEIVPMIRACKDAGAAVELITNGTLLSTKCSVELMEAGLDGLWVSLDGATPHTYTITRVKDAFRTVVGNLLKLNELRHTQNHRETEVGVVFVATKKNIDQLPAVAELSMSVGATRFLVTNILPYSEDMKDEILYSHALWNLRGHLRHIRLPRMDADNVTLGALGELLKGYEWHDFIGAGFSSPFNTCPFVEKGSTCIRWDGHVSPCLSLLHAHQELLDGNKRQVDEFLVGSVKERPLQEIWADPSYVAFRERIKNFEFSPCTSCNGCEMVESNYEDCFGNDFPACGGCLWAQGFIQCP